MRRTALPIAAILLTAACSTATHTAPSAGPAPSSASASPSTTELPGGIDIALGNILNDSKKITHDRGDNSPLAADCRQLGADASSASVQTIPNQAWQAQWVKAMSELQKAADECSSASSTGNDATMQQALTDLTAADDDLQTFYKMTKMTP